MAWTYVIDTSALIDMAEAYPESAFPGVWESLGCLAKAGRARAPMQVFEEIHRPESLHQWCVDNKAMFRPIGPSTWRIASQVTKKFPKLVDSDIPRQQADPFIIAMAVALKGSLSSDDPLIITHEDSHRLNKIPSVAESFGVESDRMTGIFDREGWKF